MATLKDSGERTNFETGAMKELVEGKEGWELLPLDVLAELFDSEILRCLHYFSTTANISHLTFAVDKVINEYYQQDTYRAITEVAQHYADGARKYAPRNWEKGIPMSVSLGSAVRHLLKLHLGWKDEPHERALLWNLFALMRMALTKQDGMCDLPGYTDQTTPFDPNDMSHIFDGCSAVPNNLGFLNTKYAVKDANAPENTAAQENSTVPKPDLSAILNNGKTEELLRGLKPLPHFIPITDKRIKKKLRRKD